MLVEQFGRLDARLTDTDRQLHDVVARGGRIGAGWSNLFDSLSHELLDARDGLAAMLPGHPLLKDLADDVVGVGRRAGQLERFEGQNGGLGQGWQNILDYPIRDVRRAIDELQRGGYRR